MALGVSGTTLLDELNRLANSGIYRVPGAMVDEARAAKQWATSLSINTNLTDTVGILNAIAGRTGNSRLDYNGVCNALANTFQLPAAQALRSMPGEVVYAIGDTGPAGGIIFYDAGSTLSWGRYLEAAVTTTSPTWVDNTNLLFANNFNANVTTSTAIGTGKANSNAWYANNTTVYQGINAARNYTGGGKTDWFIPSQDELNQLYVRKTTPGLGLVTTGGYTEYASSTQGSGGAFTIFSQVMSTGVQANSGKYDYYYFRPIRYV